MKKILLTLSLSLILIRPVPATLITFDDITMEDLIHSYGGVPADHGGGLGWSGFSVGLSDGGGNVVAWGGPYSLITSGLQPFTLNGAYLSYNSGQPQDNRFIEVRGTYRGTVLYDNTYLLNMEMTWLDFNYFGVDTVVFRVPGAHAGEYGSELSYISFIMDDLVINESAVAIPEPATYLAGVLLVLPLAIGAFQRLRQAK